VLKECSYFLAYKYPLIYCGAALRLMLVQLYHSHILAETDDTGNIQVLMLLSFQCIAFGEIQLTIQSVNRLIFVECLMTGCRLYLLGSKKLVNYEFKTLYCLPLLIGWSRE
jgi:hypothetical protein